MNLNGRRESKNVDDRRSMSTAGKAGVGIGGVIIAAIFAIIMGKDPTEVLQSADLGNSTATENYQPTPEEEELAKFASQILAGTEDVWTAEFKKMGRTYVPPKLVLFKNSVQSGCGGATSASGPFYCSADQSVYLDLAFFTDMKNSSAPTAISPTHTSSRMRSGTMCSTCSAPSTRRIAKCPA